MAVRVERHHHYYDLVAAGVIPLNAGQTTEFLPWSAVHGMAVLGVDGPPEWSARRWHRAGSACSTELTRACSDIEKTPIAEASVTWAENQSLYIAVATRNYSACRMAPANAPALPLPAFGGRMGWAAPRFQIRRASNRSWRLPALTGQYRQLAFDHRWPPSLPSPKRGRSKTGLSSYGYACEISL